MMKTLLIGIGFKARQGKNFVANCLVQGYKDKYDIREYSLGAELKRELNELDQRALCEQYGVLYDENPDRTDPLCQSIHGKQSRLLQHYGTEVRRAADSFVWVKKLRARIEEEQPQIAVISDVRFKNELYFIKAFGGFTIKVTRYGFIDPSRDPNHKSETELDGAKFDFEINCLDGAVDELRRDTITVFEMIEQAMVPEIPELDNVVVHS